MKKSASTYQHSLPWWASGINYIGRFLETLPFDINTLHPNSLWEKACRTNKIFISLPDKIRTPLTLLVQSANAQKDLTPLGRFILRNILVRSLGNYLQIETAIQKSTNRMNTPVQKPVFIVSLPRTGTTLLQRILSQESTFRSLQFWEARHPCPPSTKKDRRIDMTEREIRFTNMLSPQMKHIHEIGAQLPEECIFLFANFLSSISFSVAFHLPAYANWLHSSDLVEAYQFHKCQLQILQNRNAPKRWILKSPMHLLGLDSLLRVYPGAVIVWTHRNPLALVPSAISLLRTARAPFHKNLSFAKLGEEFLEYIHIWVREGMRVREKTTQEQNTVTFVDIAYSDLIRSPLSAIKTIYQAASMELKENTIKRMQSFLKRNQQHKHGKHHYTLEEFSIHPERVKELFRPYCERFGVEMT